MEAISAPLKGNVAIVTGASRGIGTCIAQKFAEHGCTHIAITYNTNKTKAEEAISSIAKINSKIKTCAIAADLMDPDVGSKIIKQALAGLEVDHIDILVSNAAAVEISDFLPIADLTKETWDKFLTSNAWAPLLMAKEVINHMQPGGRIIFVSSASSKYPNGDPLTAYGASKAALDAVSRNMAASWSLKYGITVNSISVGATATDAVQGAVDAWGKEIEEELVRPSLLKRLGRPEEVADIIAFVASPQAAWITGNAIPANGGGLCSLQS